jgi:hydrogenase maturation protein HypF
MSVNQVEAVSQIVRLRILVTGVVQGVGFRPFVYNLARAQGLTGFVGNNGQGVFIEIEGEETAVDVFCHRLQFEAPPLAYVSGISSEIAPLAGSRAFSIVQSQNSAEAGTLIPSDISICDDCERELLDPRDRRYGYPFINCTHCGPRFTIIKAMPYDRPYTTMAGFSMCPRCQAEYDDPLDRRFHAQPNSCPVCGPHIWLETADQDHDLPVGQGPVAAAQSLLRHGKIVAVKGVGGFHLACDAGSDEALGTLRQRKGRIDKPLAVMAKDLAAVRQFAFVSAAEEALLTSKERPIVLLRKKVEGPLTSGPLAVGRISPLVAPGNNMVGVMLPYTPLHILLFHSFVADSDALCPVLVMTSANRSNDPIVKDNDEARAVLSGLADAFLMHNRDIYGRCDDSVLRLVESEAPRVMPLRRSRGYAPFPVKLPFALPPTLAVGGELKATFCLTKGTEAYMSQHIGDMENLETLAAFEAAVSHFKTVFHIAPERIACDQHPLYLSKQWAERQDVPVVTVQHHHAHIASVMAEHRLQGERPVMGFSFDGTGYGSDGAVWGGELLLADYAGFQRLAHLNYIPLAGGDTAVKRPYRLALAYLWAAGLDWDETLPAVKACPEAEQSILRRQLEQQLNTVPSSSMGRLFDAVASLCGIRQVVNYEGQAAVELEAVAAEDVTDGYQFDISGEGIFDAAPVIRAVVADVMAGVETAVISAKFHNAVANLIVQLSLRCREQTGLNQVALSGGVFQNVRLLESAVRGLRSHKFEVLTHRLVPPNDGGLALGQAVIVGMKTVH